jgi:hypothetical protein
MQRVQEKKQCETRAACHRSMDASWRNIERPVPFMTKALTWTLSILVNRPGFVGNCTQPSG